jgi:hypothetical protein
MAVTTKINTKPQNKINIHLSWDSVINRIRLGGLIYSLESFLQLNMCRELQIFAFVYIHLDAS